MRDELRDQKDAGERSGRRLSLEPRTCAYCPASYPSRQLSSCLSSNLSITLITCRLDLPPLDLQEQCGVPAHRSLRALRKPVCPRAHPSAACFRTAVPQLLLIRASTCLDEQMDIGRGHRRTTPRSLQSASGGRSASEEIGDRKALNHIINQDSPRSRLAGPDRRGLMGIK